MKRSLWLLPVLLAASLALAASPMLTCKPIESAGEAGSGLAKQVCHYRGQSLDAAYRAYMAHEKSEGERASPAQFLPAQLPKQSVSRSISEDMRYQVRWQNRSRVTVVLYRNGDLPAEDTYRFQRHGGMVEITRLYQAP